MNSNVSKTTIASVFLRNGGEGEHTKLFENLSEPIQGDLREKAILREDEEPVVAYNENGGDWCLITTQRFIWSKLGQTKNLEFRQLKDATIDSSLAIQHKATSAADLRDLKLITNTNEEISIEIEPGFPFSGIWNALKFLSTRNPATG